jgi:hypothetical protein
LFSIFISIQNENKKKSRIIFEFNSACGQINVA